MSQSSLQSVKFKYRDEFRRFSVASPVCTQALVRAASEAFRLRPHTFALRVDRVEDAACTRVTILPVAAPALSYQWASGVSATDGHAAFRLSFTTTVANTSVLISHTGVSWYNTWCDSERVAEGPTRYSHGAPYYDTTTVVLPKAGAHVVAIHAHSVGEQTRILLKTNPFVCCDIVAADPSTQPISAVTWTCASLSAYGASWRWSNLQGWMENCTLSVANCTWRDVAFDDTAWAAPIAAPGPPPTAPEPLSALAAPATSALSTPDAFALVAQGSLWETYGYAKDNRAARFVQRKLALQGAAPTGLDYGPPQGAWWRFDAQRCQLLRPELTIKAPRGAVVEICYCQALIDGKATPYVPLSGSDSCAIDRYTFGGDVGGVGVVICPLEPRGCRYVEVHVVCDDSPELVGAVQLMGYAALFRCYGAYHAAPIGAFACATDAQLGLIWKTGVDSTRSCVEDCPIDGPCRERGQWTGDTLAVTLPNLVATYDDVRPAKVTLLQSSNAADAHGVISGNCPEGGVNADYSLIWFRGAWQYYVATGDLATLGGVLLPRARKCMDYFLSAACYKTGVGFTYCAGAVIDWGYSDNHAFAVSVPLNALLLTALQAMVDISTACAAVDPGAAAVYVAALAMHAHNLSVLLKLPAAAAGGAWDPAAMKLGMHAAALVLRSGLLDGAPLAAARAATQAYIKAQLSACFPIAKSAARLSDPSKRSANGFYTPYFQTFTFEGLFKAGDADWCIAQYKEAWGWALTQSSTWLEVFDVRWEAVHSWGGCPTWQLSRFLLGFAPRLDIGPRHFALDLHVGSTLPGASGAVPARSSGPLLVSWTRADAASVHFTLTLDATTFISGWPGASAGAWTQLNAGVHTALMHGCV
jgi:hypothetical protein